MRFDQGFGAAGAIGGAGQATGSRLRQAFPQGLVDDRCEVDAHVP